MNKKKIKIENHEFIFKYLGSEPTTREKTTIDGYRALVNDKNGLNYKILFELSCTSYNSENEKRQKLNSKIIQDKYGNLENCFYQVALKHLEEKIAQNNLKNEMINIVDYL